MADDDVSEIEQNLAEYEEQLAELRALLKESDEDAVEEIQAVIKDLEEAVELSKELLEAAKQREREQERAASNTGTAPLSTSARARTGATNKAVRGIEAAITQAPEVKAPAVLGADVKKQLRERQQRAALEGKVEPAWAIGATVRTGGPGGPGVPGGPDGQGGREGVVRGVSKAGLLIVTLLGDDGEEEAEYEAGALVYLDDAQRQQDEREAMKSLTRGSGLGREQSEANAARNGGAVGEKKRKHGETKGKNPHPKTDKITHSWQSFKAGKKVAKKMTGIKAKKETKG